MLSVYARLILLGANRFLIIKRLSAFYVQLSVALSREVPLGVVLEMGKECGLSLSQTLFEISLLKYSEIIRSTSLKAPLGDHSLLKLDDDFLNVAMYCAAVAEEPFRSFTPELIGKVRLLLDAANKGEISVSMTVTAGEEEDEKSSIPIEAEGSDSFVIDTGLILKKGFPSRSGEKVKLVLLPAFG